MSEEKITFAEMRDMGVLASIALTTSAVTRRRWRRLSDIEDRFICKACGKRGADVRPDFNSDK